MLGQRMRVIRAPRVGHDFLSFRAAAAGLVEVFVVAFGIKIIFPPIQI